MNYVIQRLIQAVLVTFILSLTTFGLLYGVKDPARLLAGPDASAQDVIRLRENLGLNKPLPVQYGQWLGKAVTGDFGKSLFTNEQVFEVMNQTPQHTYQVLTKRPDVLLKFSSRLHFTPNIWMGVSVEDQRVVERIGLLRQVAAHVRFLSLEPLLGPLPGLNLEGIHWVIVGGESGHHARPVAYEWIENIRLQCEQAEIAFFFKQWGGPHKSQAGRLLNGRTYDQMPVAP